MDRSLEMYSQALHSYVTEETKGIIFGYDIRQIFAVDDEIYRDTMPIIELGMAISIMECRRLIGDDWRPQYVQFMHSEPNNLASLEHIFGKNLHFNQDRNATFLSHKECETPIPADWLQRHLGQSTLKNEAIENISFTLQVDRSIRHMFTEQCCSIDDIAQYFRISPRTLQHRLKQEGSHYQALLDQIRIDLAYYYLKNSNLSITAIAERLHFSETAAFSRFFKSKTKKSPLGYKKSLKHSS